MISRRVWRAILDLDETLISETNETFNSEYHADDVFYIDSSLGGCVYVRPGILVALELIKAHFNEIIVYTASSRRRAAQITDYLLPDVSYKLYTREHCLLKDLNGDTYTYKPLNRPRYFPKEIENYDSPYTMILDDNRNTVELNTGGSNYIVVKPFDPAKNMPFDVSEFEKRILAHKSKCL